MLTKEDFAHAYKKFPPSKSELFFLKYVSMHNLHNHFLIESIIILAFFTPFIIELVFYALNYSLIYKIIPSAIYILGFFLFGVYWTIIWYKKNKRFKQIRKYLGISKKEYKQLVEAYFYHRYPSIKEYIKFNCKK